MIRHIIIWVLLVSVSATVALNTSWRVRTQEQRLEKIHNSIEAEQDRIRVLTAEWHTLKSPARLDALVARHLPQLIRITPNQMLAMNQVAALPTGEDESVTVAIQDVVPDIKKADKKAIADTTVKSAAAKVAQKITSKPDVVAAAVPAKNDQIADLISHQKDEPMTVASIQDLLNEESTYHAQAVVLASANGGAR